MANPVIRQQDIILAYAPPTLQDEIGGELLVSLGQGEDTIQDRATQAILVRMPGRGDPSQLPLIGNDRVMTQGPGESNAAFVERLTRAFETWQHAGSARSVLEQAFTYVEGLTGATGAEPVALIVGGYRARKWTWLLASDDPTEAPSVFYSPADNWAWDGLEFTRWWRAWLVLFAYRSAPVLSGATASLASSSGAFVTVTGLAGLTAGVTSLTLPGYLTIGGAATASNNATYQITQYLSSTSCVIAAPGAVVPDANNGALSWNVSYYPGLQPAPVVGFPGKVVGGNSNQAVGVQLPGAANSVDTSAYFAQLRSLVRLWKSAGTFYPWFVLSFGGDTQVPDAGGSGSVIASEFTPWTLSSGLGNPDGTWGTWAKRSGTLDVVARVSGAPMGQFDCFIDGTGRIQDGFMVT